MAARRWAGAPAAAGHSPTVLVPRSPGEVRLVTPRPGSRPPIPVEPRRVETAICRADGQACRTVRLDLDACVAKLLEVTVSMVSVPLIAGYIAPNEVDWPSTVSARCAGRAVPDYPGAFNASAPASFRSEPPENCERRLFAHAQLPMRPSARHPLNVAMPLASMSTTQVASRVLDAHSRPLGNANSPQSRSTLHGHSEDPAPCLWYTIVVPVLLMAPRSRNYGFKLRWAGDEGDPTDTGRRRDEP